MKRRTLLIGVAFLLLGAVGGLASEGFTGSWTADITISPLEASPFTAFQSTLDVGFCIDYVVVSSISDFDFGGWVWQEFDLDVNLGLLSFSGQLLFEPQGATYVYAQGCVSLITAPVTTSIYGAMTGATQSEAVNYGSVFEITADLLGGAMSITAQTFFSADLSGITFTSPSTQSDSVFLSKTFLTDPTIALPPVTFSGQKLIIAGEAFCCMELEATTTFGIYGFESQEVDLTFLHVFGIPLNIGLDFTYTLQSKSHTFTPYLESDFGCLSIYTSVLGTGGHITGLDIYGIKFELSLAGATLRSVSNLDTTQYVISTPAFGSIVEPIDDAIDAGHLYYASDIWEILSLDVDVPPVGSGFGFSVDTFFSESTGLLFEWTRSTMEVSLELGASVELSSSMTIDTTGFTDWTIGFAVSW